MTQRSESTLESAALGPELSALVDELGIVRDYVDGFGQAQRAPRDAVFCALDRLGYTARTERDAEDVRMERARVRNQRGLSPVSVAWGGALDTLPVWSESGAPTPRWRVRVSLEDGREMLWGGAESERQIVQRGPSAGVAHGLPVRLRLPFGYHRLELEWGAQRTETLLISAPQRAPRGPSRSWGLFAPAYALRGRTAQGAGTLTELSELCELVGRAGGDFVATLPMMAQFLEEPFDTSPFAPASRLFWNEALLNLTQRPELPDRASADELLHAAAFKREAAELEQGRYVQPARHIQLIHQILEPLAQRFFAAHGAQDPRFRRFLAEHPYAERYARFRATCDAHGAVCNWPAELHGRPLTASDGTQRRYQMHLYAQWQMNLQLAAATERARASGVRLHLDLPLGVHSQSFDVWSEPNCFVTGLEVGAPRDALCTEGQAWGFSPAHPEGQRNQQYRYFIAYLRNQLRYAGLLRIDHVMGLHRTFCVPQGMTAREGLYLKQPHEELHAICTLEAHRSGSVLVGEDLGTVPSEVRQSMSAHGLKRMYVMPFEISRGVAKSALRPMPKAALASLNTHDMPTFGGLWQGHDIHERLARGVIDSADLDAAYGERRRVLASLLEALDLTLLATREEALRAAVTRLAKSNAEMVLVALEDLWGEIEPQNVPGTFEPERNFCRRVRYRLDEIPQLPQVTALLKEIRVARGIPPALAESTVV